MGKLQVNRDELVSTIWHWEAAMLRRPDMDNEEGYCYEEADGTLIFTRDPRHRRAMRLCVWRGADGFYYTSISHAPYPFHRFARGVTQ